MDLPNSTALNYRLQFKHTNHNKGVLQTKTIILLKTTPKNMSKYLHSFCFWNDKKLSVCVITINNESIDYVCPCTEN